jgi:hypothetical protein
MDNDVIGMSNVPGVTVLMPVYNGREYLREAMDSILGQTFADLEFLIIDDGSTDDSVAVVQSYSDARIRLVRNETNRGVVATLNRGLDLARGEYIARMDADDVSLPERLQMQMDFLDAHPGVGVLGSACRFIDARGALGQVFANPSSHELIGWRLYFTCPILHPTVMMRRDVIRQRGGYGSEVISGREQYGAQDYDLWRQVRHVTRLANLPQVLVRIRRHQSQLSQVYGTENRDNSVLISHAAIAETLGASVRLETVDQLWKGEFGSIHEANRVAELIYRLYHAVVRKAKASRTERHAIARDAFSRLFSIAYDLQKRGLDGKKAAAWAWRVRPLHMSQLLAHAGWRKLRP